MFHIHGWGKWQLVSQDYFEEFRGVYLPYVVQKKVCKKCNQCRVNISYPKKALSYRNETTQSPEKDSE